MNIHMMLLREKHLEMIMEWRMRPYITRYMNTDPSLSMESQRMWFENIRKNGKEKIWVIYFDEVPIGIINLFDMDVVNKRCSWGYYVAEREFRSLRLAAYLEWNLYDYVFDNLKYNKLCNETFVENKYVIKLHLFCGSKQEGVRKKHVYKNGSFYDISVGAIIAEEWYVKRETIQYERYKFE